MLQMNINSIKILGIMWNIKHDTLEFNFQEYVNTPNKFSVSDGPGNRQLFKDGLFPVFELVS